MEAHGAEWFWCDIVFYFVHFGCAVYEQGALGQWERKAGRGAARWPLQINPTNAPLPLSPLPSQPLGAFAEAGLCIRVASILNKNPQIKTIFFQFCIGPGTAVI